MQILKEFLSKLNIANADAKTELLEKYMMEILEWNEKVNLTAIRNKEEFVQKHYIDSLLCADSDEFRCAKYIIDVGTGGGFPGVPIAVCFPEKRFVLMDSLAKRLKIVDEICETLGINNVKTLHGRAEDLARQEEHREKFDLCVSRAVANMSTLSEYCLPFVKIGGCFIAYKGPDCKSELDDASNAIRVLGGKFLRVEATSKTAEGTGLAHNLIYINKKKPTPKAYPRQAGTPARKPI